MKEFIFYYNGQGEANSFWLVGPKLGSPEGGILTRSIPVGDKMKSDSSNDQTDCVPTTDLKNNLGGKQNVWKTYKNKSWAYDSKIIIECKP